MLPLGFRNIGLSTGIENTLGCVIQPILVVPYHHREFRKREQILSQVLPQLKLTVDEVLNPLSVRRLMEIEKAQQVAERDALKMELERLKALMKLD